VGGQHIEIYKQPVTDPGKNSKAGRLKLITREGEYATVPQSSPGKDELVEVFRDGRLLVDYSLEDVRGRAAKWFGRRAMAMA